MKKKILWAGSDHTELLTIFRKMVLRTGIRKGESLIFSGCQGPCYSMATFFSFGIRDLGLDLYFALDSDMTRLWPLKGGEVGFVAGEKKDLVRARVIVLMSGLVQLPLPKTLDLINAGLTEDGVIIGETVQPGLFEQNGWDKRIKFRYIFEFSLRHPTAYEVEDED